MAKSDRPTIVCLCGSTRFNTTFGEANLRETLAGKIVLSIGCDIRTDTEIFGHMSPEELERTKTALDELHKRKIDLADEILVLNVDGYIGDSTKSEIRYATQHGKLVRYYGSMGMCERCWQMDAGQTGEYPCPKCGVPTLHDRVVADV